jgi:ACS family tartrate transporter-like MFS transporter
MLPSISDLGVMSQVDLERHTLRKISWRLLPLVATAYFIANLDRTNISYAALQMNQDLHLSAADYGLGAGLFSITYLILELPSNLAMARFGARLWIARIMITWGLVSAGMAAITGPHSFVAMRLLLGAAEAGFVPGILLYITYWFPAVLSSRAVAIFLVAAPLSNSISALLSAPILALDGFAGLRGWQWMFVVEAVPAVLLGCVVAVVLTDRPAQAKWLAPAERDWLQGQLDRERPRKAVAASLWRVAANPYVIALTLVYIGRNVATFSLAYFMPQIVGGLGLNTTQIGLLTAIPYCVASLGMWFWSRSSDRTGERRWHLTFTMVLAAAGLAAAGVWSDSLWSIVAITAAAVGCFACTPGLFAIAPLVLTEEEMPSGVAIINGLAQLGSLAGPYAVGWIRTATGSFQDALYLMAACSAIAAVIAAMIRTPVVGRR